jgi:hypothetical protein
VNVNGSAESIRKAKSSVEKRSKVTGRWTRTTASNGCVALYVLKDKQPLGYILADHTRNLVRAFDSEMRHISTFQMLGYGKIASVSRAPAYREEINGEQIELCSDCQSLILYQQLGPEEGYV